MSLQDQLNNRGQIDLAPIYYDLTTPLIIRAGCHVNGAAGAILRQNYTGPAFITPTDQEASHWSIRHLRMEGGGVQLNAATDTGQAIAPSFFELDDLTIVGAPVAYDASNAGGAWMGALSRVHAVSCVDGFKQTGGTTISFTNCFAAHGTGKGWHLYGVYSCSLRSCAMDDHQQQAAYFGACRGLSIDAFYMEGNGTDGSPIVLFDGCDGLAVNGWWTLLNQLRTGTSGTSYLLQINASRGAVNGLSCGGSPRPEPDTKTGTGTAVPLLVSGSPQVVQTGCTVQPIT